MNNALRAYMDHLFAEAPPTKQAVELKEEMLQNLTDKYNDLLAEGKSEEAAYNIAVASIGDVRELIDSLKQADGGPGEEQLEKSRRRSAVLVSVAVALYILCVVPCLLLGGSMVGPVLMFVMIAAATGLLIYNHMTRPRYIKKEDTVVEEFKAWKGQNTAQNQLLRAVSGVLWALTVAGYLLLSFWTMDWHITWVLFLIAGAVNGIIKAIFDLRK